MRSQQEVVDCLTHLGLTRSRGSREIAREATLLGKTVVSKNIVSGKLSQWEFRADGTSCLTRVTLFALSNLSMVRRQLMEAQG